MGQLEDFLAGKPLSADIAALKQIRSDQPEEDHDLPYKPSNRKELDDDEREWLRRLTTEPGWKVFQKLCEWDLDARQQNAIIFSQTDPLKNKEEISNVWMYLSCLRELYRSQWLIVLRELEMLKKHQKESGIDGTALAE